MIFQRIFVLSFLTLLSLILLAACGGAAAPASPPTATPAPTQAAPPTPTEAAPPPPTPAPTPTPAPAATATSEVASEHIEFEFVRPLSTVEQVGDIEIMLHEVEGVLSVRGDDFGITITYNPELITPDQLRQQMATIGFPVKP